MVKLNNFNKGRLCLMLICIILTACSNINKGDNLISTIYEPSLYGKWQMIDWNGDGKPELDISLNFNSNDEYTDSRSGDTTWNYKYIEPDSLILYHHGAYEERYKIVALTSDSLIMELSESLFHAEDDGKEVAIEYSNGESQTFKFIRK